MGILRWLMAAVVLGGLPATAQVADLRSTTQFRVCADPANAPMSMRDGSGFENKLAEAFGEWLGVPVTYTWFPSGMGFIARTLRTGDCDVVMGYAQGDELVQNTNHYYTSVFGIVTRKDGDLAGVAREAARLMRDCLVGTAVRPSGQGRSRSAVHAAVEGNSGAENVLSHHHGGAAV